MFRIPTTYSFFRKQSISYENAGTRINNKNLYQSEYSRSITTIRDLIGTYHSLSKKHLSPIFGAVGAKSKAIQHFYEAIIINNKQGITATEKLILSLFNQIGTEFRTTQNKTSAAYSLNPSLTAKIILELDAKKLDEITLMNDLDNEWRTHHKKITGRSLSKKYSMDLIKNIVASKDECNENLYPACYTELILLTFLFLKSKNKQDLIDYVHAITGDENSKNLLSMDTKNHIPAPNELFLTLTKYEKKNGYYNLGDFPKLIKDNYEICLLSLLQSTYLYKVSLSHYGYNKSKPVANCTEVSFHNFCNVLLHNNETLSFDLSLLAPSLTPHDSLAAIYQMQEFKTDMIDSANVGQAFMDLLSANPKFIYANDGYELKATPRNFIPVINFLFGINANALSELDKLFSDDKRKFQFIQKNTDSIDIYMDLPTQKKSYQMTFTFTHRHCAFESNYLANNASLGKEIDQFFVYALDHFNSDPAWLSVLSGVYNRSFKFLFYRNLCANSINNILFYIAPLQDNESFLLIKHMLPHIKENPHWQTLFKYIIQKKDIFYRLTCMSDRLLLKALIDCDINVNASFSRFENKTALHVAKNTACVNILLNAKANPNALDDHGKTPLHYAVLNNENGMEVTKQLLAANANPNILDNNGMPPIYYAVQEIFNYLLEGKIDPNLIDGQGDSLLHCLVRGDFGGQITDIRKLLVLGANPNIMDKKGRTPLFYAFKDGVAKCLIDARANHNALDYEGKTPLFTVYDSAVIKRLLNAGANPNVKDIHHQTPIFMFKTPDSYKLLIQAGADLTIEDLQGKTPLDQIKHYYEKYKIDWLLEVERMILEKNVQHTFCRRSFAY